MPQPAPNGGRPAAALTTSNPNLRRPAQPPPPAQPPSTPAAPAPNGFNGVPRTGTGHQGGRRRAAHAAPDADAPTQLNGFDRTGFERNGLDRNGRGPDDFIGGPDGFDDATQLTERAELDDEFDGFDRQRTPHRRRQASSSAERARTAIRGVGESLITVGMALLLFVFYEVYVTDWQSAQKQEQATADLDAMWAGEDPGNERQVHDRFGAGEGFAKIYIPKFGSDYVFTVLEGTSDDVLAIGPGHYEDSAMPGEPGNFAVAGHRVGKGSPFNDLDGLNSCDAIVIETRTDWFVYRVLPMSDEKAGWDQGRGGSDPKCVGVSPLGGEYAEVAGRQIVSPSRGDVVATVPNRPDAVPAAEDTAPLITLTTCHPRFSARQRMIIHGVFHVQYPKDQTNPDARPAELKEG